MITENPSVRVTVMTLCEGGCGDLRVGGVTDGGRGSLLILIAIE